MLIIISSRWCGAGEDGTSVNGGTVLEYGGVISSGAGAAGIAPERTRAAESVAIGAPCDDDNQDDDSKNHDDAELLSEASYDCNNDNALANQELASGYTRLQPNAGDIWWHVDNINDRTMSYHEAPHKCTTILLGVARKKLQDLLLRAKRAARHGWDEAEALRRMPVPGKRIVSSEHEGDGIDDGDAFDF